VAVGVPEITQVEAFIVTPLGSAPPAVIAQVVVAPLLATFGVTDKATPTVPVVEPEKLMVGATAGR